MSIYNPAIPQATDLISNSQPQILGNFGELNTQFGVDHVAFNTGSANGDGTHKQITFDNAPSAPNPTGTISNIYPQLVSAIQQLFFKNATQVWQLTGLPLVTGTSGATGWGVRTPWGITINFGQPSFSGSSSPIVWQIPFTTTVFTVVTTINSNVPTNNATVSGSSTTGTTLFKTVTGTDAVFFLAIGD